MIFYTMAKEKSQKSSDVWCDQKKKKWFSTCV